MSIDSYSATPRKIYGTKYLFTVTRRQSNCITEKCVEAALWRSSRKMYGQVLFPVKDTSIGDGTFKQFFNRHHSFRPAIQTVGRKFYEVASTFRCKYKFKDPAKPEISYILTTSYSILQKHSLIHLCSTKSQISV